MEPTFAMELQNESPLVRSFAIEPWGEVHPFPAGSRLRIELFGRTGVPTMQVSEACVFWWCEGDCRYRAWLDGVLISSNE